MSQGSDVATAKLGRTKVVASTVCFGTGPLLPFFERRDVSGISVSWVQVSRLTG